jgi:hypothetical protein
MYSLRPTACLRRESTLIEQKKEFPRTTTPDSLVRPEVVPSMKKRHSLGTLMLVLLLPLGYITAFISWRPAVQESTSWDS